MCSFSLLIRCFPPPQICSKFLYPHQKVSISLCRLTWNCLGSFSFRDRLYFFSFKLRQFSWKFSLIVTSQKLEAPCWVVSTQQWAAKFVSDSLQFFVNVGLRLLNHWTGVNPVFRTAIFISQVYIFCSDVFYSPRQKWSKLLSTQKRIFKTVCRPNYCSLGVFLF